MPFRHMKPVSIPIEAPRLVPRGLRLALLFGGLGNVIGWLLLAAGLLLTGVVGRLADVRSLPHLVGRLEQADGIVNSVRGTSTHYNDRQLMAVTYRFHDQAGVEREGVSYTTDDINSGASVAIEYAPHRPAISRVRGMDRGPAPPWVLIFPTALALIGAILVVRGVRRGRRNCQLLREGRVGAGRLVGKVPTLTEINNATVMEMTFEFETSEGRVCRTKLRTHRTALLEDEEREPLLYHPLDPTHAALLDHLPGAPRVGADGSFGTPSPWVVTNVMLSPMLAGLAALVLLVLLVV